jgi:spermidine synthase
LAVTATGRAAVVAFSAAAATLFTQVLVHRLVSAKLLNNYAFLVISLTMLGFAASGVVLARWLPEMLGNREDSLVACAALFALTVPAASWAFCRAPSPIPTHERAAFVLGFLETVPVALVFALPFFFSGLMLGLLLADRELPTPRIYFADLVGSAAGALAVLPAITHLGVEASLLGGSALLLVVTALLQRPRRLGTKVLAVLACAGLLAATLAKDRVFALRPQVQSFLDYLEGLGPPYGLEHVAWDPVARIEVSRIPPPDLSTYNYPCLIGGNREFHARFRRMLTQNNWAFTYAVDYDGDLRSLTGIEETIYTAAYHATPVTNPRVLVIGVGGGFDVLSALRFGASEVTGVEVNGATVEILTRAYRDYFRHWAQDPRVHLVHDEGRRYLEESDRRFDVLQLSGVDSYSGTAGAAHVFSENYLYTAEAFDLYLSRLSDQGILSLMRVEHVPEREMIRALTTAVAALRRAGVSRPAEHVAMITATARNFAALLVKKTPFRSEELARLRAWADASPFFKVSAAPGDAPPAANAYQAFLLLRDPRLESAFIRAYLWDISPATDDRPFFFKDSFAWHLWSRDRYLARSVPMLEYSVLLLLSVVGVAAAATVYVPLRYLTRHGQRAPHAARYALFFAGTGLGYLAIEIALLQKFGLFLGHPNHALSVVLASLLFATGLGSLFSRRLLGLCRELRFVGYALAALLLLEALALMPRLPSLVTAPFWARAAVVTGLVFPIGFLLGAYMPTALDRLKQEAPAFVPWAWGINGIFSVLSPLLAIWFSTCWGMSALLLSAIPVYLAVGFCYPEAPKPAATTP